MAKLNPDFRGADEVEVPDNLAEKLGWYIPDVAENEEAYVEAEARKIEQLQDDIPICFTASERTPVPPEMKEAWDKFQESKGRYPGSQDLSLMDEWVFGKPLLWEPQIIGSCVASNTFRPWVASYQYQCAFYSGEYLGGDEEGPNNIAFFAPYSYGCGRRRGNLRRGDGSFCGVQAESLMKDGVVRCDLPQVRALYERYNVPYMGNNIPEPQGQAGIKFYRALGEWSHLDDLKQYASNRLLESPSVNSVEYLMELADMGYTAFVCSMEAIHKVGTHRDGFAIHARNPRDQWAHNMSFQGYFKASDGEVFIRESNESWGAKHIYNRRQSEVDQAFRSGRLTVQAIGKIDTEKSQLQNAA